MKHMRATEFRHTPARQPDRAYSRHAAARPAPPYAIELADRTGARPLPAAIASEMGARFGRDFGDVTIQADSASAAAADALDASAFTIGRHISFGSGTYAPETTAGRHLIAHELAHVAQHSDLRSAHPVRVSQPGDAAEQQADRAADLVLMGGRPRIQAVSKPTLSLQKKPKPPTHEERLKALEAQQGLFSGKLQAVMQDSKWRAMFGARMATYRAAIHRVTAAFDAAQQGFTEAQVKQAQQDALRTQLIGAAISVGLAASFEWIFTKGLGLLTKDVKKIEKWVEALENPANAAVSGAVNVAGVLRATQSQQEGQVPPLGASTEQEAPGTGPLSYFARKSEELEKQVENIENAFVKRSNAMAAYTSAEWSKFDPAPQEAMYQKLYDDLAKGSLGVDDLKAPPALAQVVERHLWALWLSNSRRDELAAARAIDEAAAISAGSIGMPEAERSALRDPKFDVGSDIEDRLNKVGVAQLAGVKLTGTIWKSNSANWRLKLADWASSYRESIKK